MRTVFLCLSAIVFQAATSPITFGQGTGADYQRARTLRERTRDKVFKDRVEPHWFADNQFFWYRNNLAEGHREFILVNVLKGERKPAFDHARLAEVLTKATDTGYEAAKLPIDGLEFDGNLTAICFKAANKYWRCSLADYRLSAVENDGKSPSSLPALDGPRPSRDGGQETHVTFLNRTKAGIKLLWIDAQAERHAYGTVQAGGQFRQHTFAGHVWLVTDMSDKTLALFEAAPEETEAIIDENTPIKKDHSEAPSKAKRPSRVNGDSPDSRWHAEIKDYNARLSDAKTGEAYTLTTDGQAGDFYTGPFHWSPDSKKLVVLRRKPAQEHKVYFVESSPKDQLQPKLHSFDYLKPGDRIVQNQPHLFDVETRKKIAVKDDLFNNPWSVEDFRWSPDSSGFTFLYNQRGHQVLRIVAVDAQTGEARAVVDEQSPTFIDYAGKQFAHFLDDAGEVIWMSERDGWNHLYLYDLKSGRIKNQITRGEWVVRGVDKVDERARQIWFHAGGIRPEQDPYYVHYCRINFDGTGLVILTDGNGHHTATFSPDRKYLIDTWSRVDCPPVTALRRADDGRIVCGLEKADISGLTAMGWRSPERFVAKGRDGATDIYGVIYRPANFDPARKHAVIEEIYAGPQAAFVPKSFRPFHHPQEMAELGFILVQMDGMGTSYRSKKFHDVCWKNLGDSGFPDRILWIQAAAEKYPYMDLSRVGIYGGSAGGQSSTRAVLAHGDFYKVAVSDCGCHDNRMDKIWWNELWMGWPVGPHYEEQSNVTQAHHLRGKLMLVVGEMDRNVDPASTLQVVNALIKADKDFELLLVPGGGHGIAESPYGTRRRQDFFVRHLLGVEPRLLP